jgi:hypothetical protein
MRGGSRNRLQAKRLTVVSEVRCVESRGQRFNGWAS